MRYCVWVEGVGAKQQLQLDRRYDLVNKRANDRAKEIKE